MEGERWTACACGQRFGSTEELTGHVLAAFPPRADAPLDGRYHGDVTEYWPHIRAYRDQYGSAPPRTTHAKARQMYEAVTLVLSFRPYLSEDLAGALESFGQDLAIRLDSWDFEAWATSLEPHLRAAAAIAHRIAAGNIAYGQQVDPGRLAGDYQVAGGVIEAAIAVLLEHGYLTDCDGRVEAAERQVTTGAYLRRYPRYRELQSRFQSER
jgi:hypothetical protein